MSEEHLAELLKDAGTRLLSPPSSVDDLLSLLHEIEQCLERVDQSPSQTMQDALTPSLKALVASEVLGHSDADVKVYVATCISEITRITAPDAPYSDDQMKEIFQLIVSSFENLHDTSSRSYDKRTTILETVAKVRSCVVMLDLECDDLILQMFQHFFKSVRDYHPEKVFASMERIMTLVLEESEDISPELLSSILEYLKKDDKNVDPSARRLGENVLNKCSSKVEPYLVQAIQTLGVSLDDYNNVVTSVFQKSSGVVECNGVKTESTNSANQGGLPNLSSEDAVKEEKETLKDTASQTEVSPASDTLKSTVTNGNPQKEVEEAEVVEEHLTEQKYDDHTENKAAEESKPNKDEVELIIKPQPKLKSNKKRGRKGNLSKATLAPSEATDAVEDTDAEEVTDLQESESKDSLTLHPKDTPADTKREIKGNLSKTTLGPSEATPAEEGNIVEELTDLKDSESNDSGILHSKDTPTDKKRGGKGNLSKTTLEPSEPTPEEDNNAEELTDLQETERKDSGSLHRKDTPADNTSPPNCDKGADIQHSLSKASENKDVDISSPSPSGDTTDESHLQKVGTGNKTDAVIQEVITSPEDNIRTESNPDVSEAKEDKVTGQETSSATDKEEATLGPVDASRKDDGSTIDSDTKTTKLSGKKVESVSDQQQDKKKIKRQGKTSLVKPPSKKEVKEPNPSPKGATKSAKRETASASSKKGSDQKSSNKKRVAGKEKVSENEKHGKELVGSKIKVWWPKDKEFYEGVVESFCPDTKKHQVLYKDGDVEVLNMEKEKWELVKGDKDSHKGNVSNGESPDASSEIHKKKKIKTNPEPSNKQGKTVSAKKRVTSSNRSKVAVPKLNQSDDEMNVEQNSDEEDSKDSGGSEDEKDGKSSDANSGDESMDETPKGAGKSKEDDVETPKTSTKSKQQVAKSYSRSKGKTVKGSGSKSNAIKPGKAKAGSSSTKGKETATGKKSQHESAKSSQSGKTKSSNTSSKAQKVETKSGNKRKRGSSKK